MALTQQQIDAPAGGSPALDTLARRRVLVEPALRSAVASLPRAMARVLAYHRGWEEETGRRRPGAGGKALRPALVLLCAEAVGSEAEDALPAAVAVELVHDFSLLHDDVIDDDLTRRHRPTAWTVFGTGHAILAGDALLALAVQVLHELPDQVAQGATARLLDAVVRLLEGQCEDVGFEQRDGVTVPECLHMAGAKTGALLGCACALGGLAGGGSADAVEHLRRYGEHLGMAFQFVDDLLGVWGDPAVTGKPVHSDLRSHKKSLPVVAALAGEAGPARELADLYRGQDPLSDAALARVADLVDAAGGRAWCREQAAVHIREALGQLAEVPLRPGPAAELAGLAEHLLERDR